MNDDQFRAAEESQSQSAASLHPTPRETINIRPSSNRVTPDAQERGTRDSVIKGPISGS